MAADARVRAEPMAVCESLAGMVLKILYWVAVVAVSLALLVALILFFESRDDSSLEGEATIGPGMALVDSGA